MLFCFELFDVLKSKRLDFLFAITQGAQSLERPKMGFAPPIGLWLKGPLRDWAESLLDEKKIREDQYLNPTLIRAKWEEHLSGRGNWQHHLWDVLMFQAWLADSKN